MRHILRLEDFEYYAEVVKCAHVLAVPVRSRIGKITIHHARFHTTQRRYDWIIRSLQPCGVSLKAVNTYHKAIANQRHGDEDNIFRDMCRVIEPLVEVQRPIRRPAFVHETNYCSLDIQAQVLHRSW